MPDPIEELYAQYQSVIRSFSSDFNSHEFILRLAHRNQRTYVRALNESAYSDTPFRELHGKLAGYLINYPDLIYPGEKEPSRNIFGQRSTARIWQLV